MVHEVEDIQSFCAVCWGECLNDDIKLLCLQPDLAIFRDMWSDFLLDKLLTLAKHRINGTFCNFLNETHASSIFFE